MSMAVIRNKDGSVSCLPIYSSRGYYTRRYDVIVFVNKLWNPYYVSIIKRYFAKKAV